MSMDVKERGFGAYFSTLDALFKRMGRQSDEVEDHIQSDADGLAEYSSTGPGYNEITTFYKFDAGGHHVRFLNLVSPDILLVHQSKMVGFYQVMGGREEVRNVQRDVKDLIVKDVNMKV
tara:strand:+ start:67099 stop:67455 length:357 start_codon:yes stop_codon:yes gene_type:complete